MSMFTPVGAGDGPTSRDRDELEAYADRLIDRFDEVAPGFKDSILHAPDHRAVSRWSRSRA